MAGQNLELEGEGNLFQKVSIMRPISWFLYNAGAICLMVWCGYLFLSFLGEKIRKSEQIVAPKQRIQKERQSRAVTNLLRPLTHDCVPAIGFLLAGINIWGLYNSLHMRPQMHIRFYLFLVSFRRSE